jgi:hypothetical protein
MPRPPQPQYADHPLKQLRRLLRPLVGGVSSSANQQALASLTGIAARTIQAVEMGARSLSKPLLHKILLETGAYWNGKTWTQGPTDIPFTAEGCRQYRAGITALPSELDRMMDQKLLQAKIALLFEYCPEKKWNRMLFAIQDALEDVRAKFFGTRALSKCFESSEIRFSVFIEKDGEIKVMRFHPASPEYLDIEAMKRGDVKLLSSPPKLREDHAVKKRGKRPVSDRRPLKEGHKTIKK